MRAQGEIETSAIIKTTTNYVESFGEDQNNTRLYGDVKIEAGDNIKLSYDTVNNAIVISLKDQLNFKPECYDETDCNPLMCTPIAVSTINDVGPDVGGNLVLEGDGLVVITTGTHLIQLDTPKVHINDLCREYTEGAPGAPGPPGPQGGDGAAGIVICGAADCCCEYCDTEAIEDCDVIIEPDD